MAGGWIAVRWRFYKDGLAVEITSGEGVGGPVKL